MNIKHSNVLMVVLCRVPMLPRKSFIIFLIFQNLESLGKWLWSWKVLEI